MFSWIKNIFSTKKSNAVEKPQTFKFHSGSIKYNIYEELEGIYYINRPARNNKTYKWYIPKEILNDFYKGIRTHINTI